MTKIKNYEKSIAKQYGQKNLGDNIISAFENAGKQINIHEDTASFDEFHMRGRDATRELAELAGLQKGMKVLDLGCGVGGPARTLAAEFGCHVSGIDLVEEYCKAATMLTKRLNLDNMVSFRQGNIMELPFDEQSFDAAWTEHTLMNIENKVKLFHEVRRILRPKGIFTIYEICSGTSSPPYFPVTWANSPEISFLVQPDELRDIFHTTGFTELKWKDVTKEALKWLQDMTAMIEKQPSGAPPPLGVNLLIGKSAAEKSMNIGRNLVEGRIQFVQGVFRKEN
jgi:ubiquinone/menaquinone biosynthesis C-methylase UbiE